MTVTLAALIDELGDAVVSQPETACAVDLSAIGLDVVTHNSNEVVPGSMFACLRGATSDGHAYADRAVAAGASALLVDHRLDSDLATSIPQVIVDDTRRRLGPLAAAVSGHPSRDLATVGLTGTNGKTTTSLMLASILESHGWATGVIGTLSGPRTTPEAPELQRALAGFVEDGCRAAVLEVSSHALTLHRVDGTKFAAVVFTNFGHDHLDLHGTPEEYFRAKASLFTSEFAPIGVINIDDTHGRLLADVAAVDGSFRIVPYSAEQIDDVEVGPSSIRYRWNNQVVDVGIGGTFNVLNSLAALVTATELGVPADVAAAGMSALAPVPGRFETIVSPADGSAGFTVVVDYAHTPDGLDEVLRSARHVVPTDASVIIVFGCVGDRDHAKRPEMGRAAAAGADRVFITSDNPRTEDPAAIIDDIMQGVGTQYRARVTLNPDRRAAIGEALDVVRDGDIVIIAGKGHEMTQDIGGVTVEFDDRQVARSFLEDLS